MNTSHKQTVTHTELIAAVRDLAAEVHALRKRSGSTPSSDAIKSVKAIARHLGIGVVTSHKMLNSGEIPARRIGDSWVASRTALNRWLAGLPAHPDAPAPSATVAPAKHRPGRPTKAAEIAARRQRGQEGAS